VSGRLNRLANEATDAGENIIGVVTPLSEGVKEVAYGFKAGATSFRLYMEGVEDGVRANVEDLKQIKADERALNNAERAEATRLKLESFTATVAARKAEAS
jgi:hypothetical protein